MKAARTRAIAGLLLVAGTTTALPTEAAPAAPAPLHVSVAVSGVVSTGASYLAGTVTVRTMRGASCSGTVRIGLRTMASTALPMKVAKGTIYWRFSIQSATPTIPHGTAWVTCTLGKRHGHGSRSF